MLTSFELFGSAIFIWCGKAVPTPLFYHGVPTPFFEKVWESLFCGNGVPHGWRNREGRIDQRRPTFISGGPGSQL